MLSGLPETYDALTMTLVSLEDDKFTSVEIRKALTMEHNRRMSKCDEQTKNKVAAYHAKKGKKYVSGKFTKSGKCFSCGKQEHFAKQCRSKEKKDDKSDTTKDKQIALLADTNYTTSRDTWLMDSAATHHVCKHKEWFENLKKIKPELINTAETAVDEDEASLTTEGIGDIRLQVKINHKNHEVTLQNVYCLL